MAQLQDDLSQEALEALNRISKQNPILAKSLELEKILDTSGAVALLQAKGSLRDVVKEHFDEDGGEMPEYYASALEDSRLVQGAKGIQMEDTKQIQIFLAHVKSHTRAAWQELTRRLLSEQGGDFKADAHRTIQTGKLYRGFIYEPRLNRRVHNSNEFYLDTPLGEFIMKPYYVVALRNNYNSLSYFLITSMGEGGLKSIKDPTERREYMPVCIGRAGPRHRWLPEWDGQQPVEVIRLAGNETLLRTSMIHMVPRHMLKIAPIAETGLFVEPEQMKTLMTHAGFTWRAEDFENPVEQPKLSSTPVDQALLGSVNLDAHIDLTGRQFRTQWEEDQAQKPLSAAESSSEPETHETPEDGNETPSVSPATGSNSTENGSDTSQSPHLRAVDFLNSNVVRSKDSELFEGLLYGEYKKAQPTGRLEWRDWAELVTKSFPDIGVTKRQGKRGVECYHMGLELKRAKQSDHTEAKTQTGGRAATSDTIHTPSISPTNESESATEASGPVDEAGSAEKRSFESAFTSAQRSPESRKLRKHDADPVHSGGNARTGGYGGIEDAVNHTGATGTMSDASLNSKQSSGASETEQAKAGASSDASPGS